MSMGEAKHSESSEIYMIDPRHLRELRLEKKRRNRANAFASDPARKHLPQEKRAELYDELKAKIELEGFNREFPIEVLLLRKDGNKDQLWQGHHRLAIAIELDLPLVPVRFLFEKPAK